jgi:hypothetical protein
MTRQTWAEILVVTNAESPFNKISAAEAADLFLKNKNHTSGIAVIPIDLEEEDPTRERFYQIVANRD